MGCGFHSRSGLSHIGVCKTLFENGLLPNIICGSAIGALIAAFVCTHSDDQLPVRKNTSFVYVTRKRIGGKGGRSHLQNQKFDESESILCDDRVSADHSTNARVILMSTQIFQAIFKPGGIDVSAFSGKSQRGQLRRKLVRLFRQGNANIEIAVSFFEKAMSWWRRLSCPQLMRGLNKNQDTCWT